jgi:hypothetical protein
MVDDQSERQPIYAFQCKQKCTPQKGQNGDIRASFFVYSSSNKLLATVFNKYVYPRIAAELVHENKFRTLTGRAKRYFLNGMV